MRDIRIGFLITARLKSKRLPLKILKDLNGKTVVECIIERIKHVKKISDVILCTSTNPQDKPLIDLAISNNIYYFNGHEEDVLQRLLDAANLFDLDYILSITADNPLLSIEYSNLIVEKLLERRYDYVTVEELPLGSAVHGLKIEALATVCKIKQMCDTEIWGYLINRKDIFDVCNIKAEGEFQRPDLRFTLDYDKDYEFINKIYSHVPYPEILNLKSVISYVDNNSDIKLINSECKQLDLDANLQAQINNYYREHIEEILNIKKQVYDEKQKGASHAIL